MQETAVTIGNFDGVHIGHQTILKKLIDVADKENLESIVITFDLTINKTDLLLSTNKEKIDQLLHFL
jgi:cytidyltransferase-like protein